MGAMHGGNEDIPDDIYEWILFTYHTIYVCIAIYIYIYNIYIYGTPKTYLSSKSSGTYSVFLTFWTLKLRAFFGDQKLHFFASLFPSHPFLSTSDSRFKIQDPKETSWIQGGRIQSSRFKISKKMNPRRQDSKFKIQDLKKKMNPRRRETRFKI